MSGALPGALSAFGLSLGSMANTVGATTVWLDLSASQLLLPTPGLGVVNADAWGNAAFSVPLPNSPSLLGATLYTQWVSQNPPDPSPPPGLAVAAELLSRRVVIW